MDIFFFQLIIIFIPGIIWERLDAQFGPSKTIQQWDILRRTFIFGLAAYVITFCVYWLLSWLIADLNFQLFKFAKDTEFLDGNSIKLIFAASVMSLGCAVMWLYASTYKLPTRLLQWMGATKRYGDELRLRDVIVYDFEGGVLFETPRVYLARKMDNIDIEFPYRPGVSE